MALCYFAGYEVAKGKRWHLSGGTAVQAPRGIRPQVREPWGVKPAREGMLLWNAQIKFQIERFLIKLATNLEARITFTLPFANIMGFIKRNTYVILHNFVSTFNFPRRVFQSTETGIVFDAFEPDERTTLCSAIKKG